MVHTKYESNEITQLTHYLHEKYPTPKIEHVKEIIHDAVHTVYHHEQLRSIYNKRTVALESLHHILSGRKCYNNLVEEEVDRQIHSYEIRRYNIQGNHSYHPEYSPFKERKTCCRQSCLIM